ncbi:PAS domain S-box protein [Aliarcobacter cryaerophilus]|uniref:PAS domain-containing protein n=1 Tax=Aliarcobacter cryaerophilus TaxID=28198 RepID=UPI0021B54C3B|nr:PAS domain S-box protein [Aliarcobacter cryaerophilus]MCT7485529.1 PAS domain S-box protein [Aliarcobacter cryaerophilus]MCT7491384.1 PAS domain S-box protein [Aliarcobacter cryaerophilus]
MENKNLIFRYFLYFILSFALSIFVINWFKNISLEAVLNDYKKESLNKYNRYYDELIKTSDFIYFNGFIKNKKLISILQKSDENKIKDELYLEFEPEFSYYKTLGIYDISFYTVDSKPILNFQDINFDDNFNLNITQKVVASKKEFVDIKYGDKNSAIVFSKPIIDEKLNLLAVVNFEFNFNQILNKLNSNSDLIFEKFVSNSSDIEKDRLFILIPIFKLEDSKTFYLKSNLLEKNIKIEKLNDFYNFLTIFFGLSLALIVFLLYKSKNQDIKNKLLKNSYDELFSQVDRYVLKLDTDLDGKITFVTKSFCEMSGYSKDEIVGKNANILRHPDMSQNFYKNLWKELRAKKIWQGEVKNIDKFGNTYWVKTSLFPKYNDKKQHIGYSSIRTDITATKQLEKTNRLLKEDLSNRLNDLKIQDETALNSLKVALMSKILDSFSHQWKKPISKIYFELLKLENIKKDLDTSKIEDVKNNIESELRELSDMLNETKTLFSSRQNMSSNLFDIVKSISSKFDNSLLEIIYDFDENIKINFAHNDLKNIIINILSTIVEFAKKYSLERVIVTISLQIEENSDEIVLKIEDNIKDIRKKEFFEQFLNFEDENKFDSKIYLAKLLADKNQAIFLCNILENSTSYYIKFKKAKIF